MADAMDSKSIIRKNVWVQLPPPVVGKSSILYLNYSNRFSPIPANLLSPSLPRQVSGFFYFLNTGTLQIQSTGAPGSVQFGRSFLNTGTPLFCKVAK